MATLTYDYGDSTAVLGPLATTAEPHAYDLCEVHAEHLTAPRGWQVVRLQTHFDPAPPSPDDLLALVDAVREAAHVPQTQTPPERGDAADTRRTTRRSREPEVGPFAADPQISPLDPASPHALRRAHFHVVSDTDE